MFNFKDLGDMTKLANEAKELQRTQQQAEERKMQALNKISSQLDEVLRILKSK